LFCFTNNIGHYNPMKFILLYLTCLALTACNGSRTQGEGWKVVGQLSDGLETRFVQVSMDRLKDRAMYEKAVSTLCKQRNICVIAFFSDGDNIPSDQSSKSFFSTGGFRDYSPVVVWWSNNSGGVASFTIWDCQRAGAIGAPLEALCGDGMSEAHSAVLALAVRAGMADACGWAKGDEGQVARSYISTLKETGRQEQFQSAFASFYASFRKGPDRPEDCKRLRAKIEEKATLARKLLIRARDTK
jgi:hypothetical protein